MGNVKYPRGRADRFDFVDDAGILDGHVPTAEGDHTRAQVYMVLVQHCLQVHISIIGVAGWVYQPPESFVRLLSGLNRVGSDQILQSKCVGPCSDSARDTLRPIIPMLHQNVSYVARCAWPIVARELEWSPDDDII